MPRCCLVPFLAAALPCLAAAQDPAPPQTTPEATDYRKTSTLAEVQRFLEACKQLPHGDRLTISVAGESTEGRPLLLVKAALEKAHKRPRLRALIIANIHAGEVEGKEAMQVIAREIANGQHEQLLAAFDLWFLPVYNPDGNEKFDPKNRRRQNGPEIVGQRANGQGLDLNRDFVKVEAPETQALFELFAEFDPHLFMDLHTTNGSYHGYHLTYSPSLALNVDPELARLSRALLDDVTATMRREHGLLIFDYGNFRTGDWERSGAPSSPKDVRGWFTHDSRPRYGVNYVGLRNRISYLAEGYSYCDFETRIATQRAYVLETMRAMASRHGEVLRACAAADARALGGEPLSFGFGQTYAEPEQLEVLIGAVDKVDPEGDSQRLARRSEVKAERMPVVRAFRAREHRALPNAWAIRTPSPEVLTLLKRHGIEFEATDEPRDVKAERFLVKETKRSRREYQGHNMVSIAGEWQPIAELELPAGAVIVRARQQLARLAAQLLEPESDEGLLHWNHFESAAGEHFGVWRIVE